MTPLLVLVFGVHPATAVGTDLLYAGVTKISGGAVHAYHGSVDWRITRRLAYGSVPAALLSLLLACASRVVLQGERRNHQHDARNRADLDRGHACFSQGAARPAGASHGRRKRADHRRSHRRARRGSRRPGDDLVRWRRRHRRHSSADALSQSPIVRIVGSDIAHAVPLTLIAGAGHWWLGSVDLHMLVSLLVGSIPGIMISSHFASRVPDRVLRPILAGTLAVVGGRLAF